MPCWVAFTTNTKGIRFRKPPFSWVKVSVFHRISVDGFLKSLVDVQMTYGRTWLEQKRGQRTRRSQVLSLMFRSDVFCASITELTTAKWKLFVLYNKSSRSFGIFLGHEKRRKHVSMT